MVISDTPAVLFVHIPKTAGTSLCKALGPEGNRHHALCIRKTQHETAAQFIERCDLATFRRYHSFAVVRHPLDRLASHYSYVRKRGSMAHLKSLDDYAAAIENNDPAVMVFRGIIPQWSFVAAPSGDTMCVNELLRYETLAADFTDFCRRAGLGTRELPHLNKSAQGDPPSDRVRRFVETYYAVDFEKFGY
jgi:hypothetical protein